MQTIIITGASKGIGREIAWILGVEAKLQVVLVARQAADLEALEKQIFERGGKVLAVQADVTQESDCQRVVDQTLKTFGKIDVIVNNAGIGSFKPLENFSVAEFDQMFGVNVKGTFLMSRAVLPYFKERKSGLIISVASDVSKRTFANGSLYCATKFAQDALCSALRREVRPFGIRVSTIYPGITATNFDQTSPQAEHKKEWLNPYEIAKAVRYVIESPPHVVIDEMTIHPLSQDY